MDDSREASRSAVFRLLDYCRREHWQGYDPYDGLNSPLSLVLPQTKFFRTSLIQLVRRSPVNLRPILGIRKGLNPKGLALAARAIHLLSSAEGLKFQGVPNPNRSSLDSLQSDFQSLIQELLATKSSAEVYDCWGYNFDWQSRAFYAPRGTPNIVCTTAAAHAMLDWYETGSLQALEIARSSCLFLLERLNRTSHGDSLCFSYTPLDRSQVHNVNMLAAALLARVYSVTGEARFREAAERAATYTLSRQRPDGSWLYGEADDQRWIDSFHTGFILVSLNSLIKHLERREWMGALTRGYDFYTERFFLADGTPGYYHNRLYPLDVHSAAQAVITFCEMMDLMPNARNLAARAVKWATQNLQAPTGYFYFQRHRFYTNKIPYMRWSQAWMLYALSLFLTKGMERNNV